MSALSDSAETNLLKLIFQNITWAGFGDATGMLGSTVPGSLYIALHTADPGESGTQTTSETAYTNYARIAVARSAGGWTVAGDTVTNAAIVNFAQCGATPGAALTHYSVGKAVSGTGEILLKGALSTPLTVVANQTQPYFGIGDISNTAA